MKKMKFKVIGVDWTIRLLSKDEFYARYGWDTLAITHLHKNRITLSPKGCSLQTIIHELVHAYIAEMCVSSCDLDADGIEEVFAELMAKRGLEIIKLAARLQKRLQV